MVEFVKKHVALIILLIILLVFPTSLTNQAKLDMRVIVTGLAIDKVNDEYEVTAQLIKNNPESSTPGSNAKVDFVTGKDKTIGLALSNISYKTGKVSAFSHTGFIVVGKSLENEAFQTLDYFMRDKIIKSSTMILFAKDKAGEEIKNTKDLELSVALGLQKVFLYKEQESDSLMVTVLDYFKDSKTFSKCSVVPVLEFEERKMKDEKGEKPESEKKQKILKSHSTLLCFKNGKKACELFDEEELGYMLANSKCKKFDIAIKNLENEKLKNSKVTIAIKDKKAKKFVKFENDKPILNVQISINNADIGEILGEENIVEIDDKVYKAIEKGLQNEISRLVKLCFDKTKNLGVDIFSAYENSYKFNYKKTDDKFSSIDEFIKELKIKVNVKVNKLDY